TFFALILGASLTSPLFYYLKKIVTPFTAPFVLITCMAIYFLTLVLDFPLLPSTAQTETNLDLLSVTTKSFGQVMFQENGITGFLFLLAIAVNSKISAIYGLY